MPAWQSLTADEVHARLGMDDDLPTWFRNGSSSSGRPRVNLPNAADADALLERLGVSIEDRIATLAARPDPTAHPAVWWLLERAYSELVSGIGGNNMSLPSLSPETGPVGRHVYVWLFLAATPSVREYHRLRGIPDDVSWASLGDLGLQMNAYRRIYDTSGLHTQSWLTLTFRGGVYILGRLQFNRAEMPFDIPPSVDGVAGPRRGDGVLSVHIPKQGVLDFDECEKSFTWASEFFPRYFSDQSARFMVAGLGWMLDEQLNDYLPPNSNLLRFQRRFHLAPEESQDDSPALWTAGDLAMLQYVFHRKPGSLSPEQILDELPQETTLQRAFVTHLRSGKHWYRYSGWYPLNTDEHT